MKRLAPGEKPPQFILFSFDGVGVSKNWDLFLRTAAESDARFTATMTGLYFLTDAKKRHYRGPGYQPGEAAIAFGGSKKDVIEEITYLNRTWYNGHEMATHFVGHFCAGTKNPGKAFNPATAAFMRRACTRPDVICATHQDVIAWMELQDPAVLKKWRSMAPVAVDVHR